VKIINQLEKTHLRPSAIAIVSLGIVPHHCPSVSLSGAAVSQKWAVVIEQRKQVVDGVVGAESREPTEHVKI